MQISEGLRKTKLLWNWKLSRGELFSGRGHEGGVEEEEEEEEEEEDTESDGTEEEVETPPKGANPPPPREESNELVNYHSALREGGGMEITYLVGNPRERFPALQSA
jgi:hypothetical protein